MTESAILSRVLIEASKLGATVWRNNTGALKDINGRLIRYGLCVGSSDIIGIYKGRFLAIEVKAPGKKPTKEQLNFIRVVNEKGGISFWIDDEKNLKNLLDTALEVE